VFGTGRVPDLVHGTLSPASEAPWGSRLVERDIDARVTVPLEVAARVSMADMVYFKCVHFDGRDYSGGVVDLFPIEIAHRLACHVTAEAKPPFARFSAAPALRAVFGIDGNARLRHVHGQVADHWIDTSDAGSALRAHCVRKRVYWRDGRLGLSWPNSLVEYQAQIDAQWDYGYARASEAFRRADGVFPRLRLENRLNVERS